MGGSKKGFGIDRSSSNILSPCPKMIDKFFTCRLRYNKLPVQDKSNKNPYLVRYTRFLNNFDVPLFPELLHIGCSSTMVVDLYTGQMTDHYFKINDGPAIRIFDQCPVLESLQWVFKWHVNLVHASREYIKGGWIYKRDVEKELEKMQEKYIVFNKVKPGDLLQVTKPEPLIAKNVTIAEIK